MYNEYPNNINMHVIKSEDKFIVDFVEGSGSSIATLINDMPIMVPSEIVVKFEDNGKTIVIDY